MFGNRLGWGIAVVVGVVYVGIMMIVFSAGGVTASTPLTGSAEATGELALPVAVGTVMDVEAGAGAGDGTTILREIVAAVGRDRELYEKFVEAPGIDAAVIPRLAALDGVLAQAKVKTARTFEGAPEQVVRYEVERPGVDELRLAGRAAGRVAFYQLAVAKKPDEARRFAEAELALGQKLFAGRQTYAELSAGLGLMGDAAEVLKRVAQGQNDAVRAERAEAFGKGLADLTARTQPVWQAISTIDPDVMSVHNGDVPLLALRAGERVWRVEATLKLGRMKYDVGRRGTPGDQRNAKAVLKQLRADADPAVAHAAKLADELTVEQFRMLR